MQLNLWSLAALLATFFLFSCSSKPTFNQRQSKPNVIIVYFDDLGYGDTEDYGLTGIPTPNFKRLAREGMRFTHFNVAQAVCTASRAALLTGCYPNRLGMAGALMPWSKTALNPEEETIASLLKKEGYKTSMLGKWHLGSKEPYFPKNYGFDSYYGIPYSHDMWPRDYEGNPVTDTSSFYYKFPPLPIIENGRQIGTIDNLEEQGELTATLTQKALEIISENQSEPFFLNLAHPMPHVPLAASSRFKGKSSADLFGDVMMELDWSVGEIINALDKAGISESTLLIVTSDNGPWITYGNHAGSTGGLKEGKSTAMDGGTRVPFYMRWPGKIEAGSISGELVTNMDVLPTIMDMLDLPLPENKIDGISMKSLITGETSESPREVFYYYFDQNNLKGVRYKNWKLVLPHKSLTYGEGHVGMDGYRGNTPLKEVPSGLYNLTHDPGEKYDVQDQYPEVVAQIMKHVEAAREDLGDALTNREGKNRRKAAEWM
ncbi:MAG: sulfatase [Bacteroidota bacterium]|nr:sulfatase [Bacteroidota bacterium]